MLGAVGREDFDRLAERVATLEKQVVCDHFWQTGIGNIPDVCMRCGATRPHGANVEIQTTLETRTDDRCPAIDAPHVVVDGECTHCRNKFQV